MKASDVFEQFVGFAAAGTQIATDTSAIAPVAIPSLVARSEQLTMLAIGLKNAIEDENIDAIGMIMSSVFFLGFADGIRIGSLGKEG